MGLKLQLVTIGDEILDGRIQDLNGPWLARFLREKGLKLSGITVCQDSLETIKTAIEKALDTSDIVITSGGLGPTKDDMTKEALAELTDSEIQESAKARELVKSHYKRYGRDWTPQTNSYHLIPKGVEPLLNPCGLAPGLLTLRKHKKVVCLPGVPREFREMVTEHWKLLHASNEELSLKPYMVRTRGIPEEAIFFKKAPALWAALEKHGKVSSLPRLGGVDILVHPPTPLPRVDYDVWAEKVSSLGEWGPLKEHVWHIGEEDLPELIIKAAAEKKLTVALAESATGGLVSHWLTNVAGASSVLKGCVVAYTEEAKMDILNVPEQTIKTHSVYSFETVEAMAKGVREKFETDIAVATSGLAGPSNDGSPLPVGTLFTGISTKQKSSSRTVWLPGDRHHLKRRFAREALMDLWEVIRLA